ncbi:spondin-1-like isoform X1 [Galleria mellonella]|uniref:Spondin-1-like isoform X1 n=1 Tax=Galleria mellonella TaxID=7137 RepID=A0A6J1WE57_GALME|nr:spondin-1-like isoform X1 [Galleria mellonella]
MIADYYFGICQGICLLLLVSVTHGNDELCDRRPLGSKTAPLPPDNRFFIDVVDTFGDLYIPNREYKVRLYSRDSTSTFMGFTISVREDTDINERNPRKPKHLHPGQLIPSRDDNASKVHPKCNNTVIETDVMPKTFVEALWIAPYKGNKCVTIFAVVAVKPDVWYSFEGPLSKRVCEDRRKAEDMQPMENENCLACEEARYQVTFEGMWTFNTHPQMFPETRGLARFSDLVGASHNPYFNLFKNNADASGGLKMLAEQGNTTQFEVDIQEELGTNVRTIIKATSPRTTIDTTVASFRVSPEHHLVSLTTAVLPSPDWFLGVSNMELCDGKGQWTKTAILNLYPMDAGTDSGQTFESPNEETSPPQPISSLSIKGIPREQMKPMARLKFDLIRTYSTPSCTGATTEATDDQGQEYTDEDEKGDEETSKEIQPITTTKSEEPVTPDPESSNKCPMTTWEEWMPCEGRCVDNKRTGFQSRFRYHLIGGTKKYIPGSSKMNEIPYECQSESTDEFQECEEDCTEDETEAPDAEAEAQSRIWENPSRWEKK